MSPSALLHGRLGLVRALLLGALLLLATACARFPSDGVGRTTRLIFTVRMDGPLSSNRVYMVAMNFTDDPNPGSGPVPVVRAPWGNGFVAGNASHFVWWDPVQFQPTGYRIFRFRDGDLLQYEPIGVPVLFDEVTAGGDTIRFTIDISQLGLTAQQQAELQTVQVNFLTMDRIPTGNDPGSKVWDALGNNALPSELNSWVNVRLPQGNQTIYDNNTEPTFLLEPRGDTPEPALDIVDWRIEVQRP